jgi:hypothetical protein
LAALTLAHPEALAPRAQAAAARLAARPWSEEFYLAGSAALALYLGHRPVADLDLMAATNRLAAPERRDLLADLIGMAEPAEEAGSGDAAAGRQPPGPAVQVETARDGYLFVRFQGVALRFFHYPYPLADPCEDLAGLAVASAVDLGLMKLGAIISRGGRRDFVDLYLLCRELPLAALLERAGDKLGHVRDFPLQALKGLADLSQIEGEPMPRLALPLAWSTVEEWLAVTVRELGRAHAGLTPGRAAGETK